MALKRRLREDEFCDDFRPIKRFSLHGIKDPDDHQQDSAASSVGSNQPIYEFIAISGDDDDDEVESPPSTADDDDDDDDDEVKPPPPTVKVVTGDEWRRITAFQSPASGETELTKKKDINEEDGDWWVKYGSMIIDNNGFLLGEFSRLDEQLYMNIM